jgi:acyl carrier protein
MNLDREDISVLVGDLIAARFEIERARVVSSARLKEDLRLDSIDGIDLIVAIEHRFGIRFDTGLLGRWITVADVENCLAW